MRFSKKAEYAIFLLAHLAANEDHGPVPAKEIAEKQNMPVNIMPQISTLLSKKGWIIGKRGAGGGLTLQVDAGTITVKDVIELIEGPIAVSGCLLKDETCANHQECPLHQVWQKAQQDLSRALEKVTIKDLSQRIKSKG